MAYLKNPFYPRYKNKNGWNYKFSYEHEVFGKSEILVTTKFGFQIAEYYAQNNMRWDNASNLKYLGKTKVEETGSSFLDKALESVLVSIL